MKFVTLTIQERSVGKCHMTKSHDNHGKVVHRPCSNCISSVCYMMENNHLII